MFECLNLWQGPVTSSTNPFDTPPRHTQHGTYVYYLCVDVCIYVFVYMCYIHVCCCLRRNIQKCTRVYIYIYIYILYILCVCVDINAKDKNAFEMFECLNRCDTVFCAIHTHTLVPFPPLPLSYQIRFISHFSNFKFKQVWQERQGWIRPPPPPSASLPRCVWIFKYLNIFRCLNARMLWYLNVWKWCWDIRWEWILECVLDIQCLDIWMFAGLTESFFAIRDWLIDWLIETPVCLFSCWVWCGICVLNLNIWIRIWIFKQAPVAPPPAKPRSPPPTPGEIQIFKCSNVQTFESWKHRYCIYYMDAKRALCLPNKEWSIMYCVGGFVFVHVSVSNAYLCVYVPYMYCISVFNVCVLQPAPPLTLPPQPPAPLPRYVYLFIYIDIL
jgi:hypothetical protein